MNDTNTCISVLFNYTLFCKMLCTDNLSPSDMGNGSFQQIADSTKQTTTMTSPVDKHTTEKTDSSYLVSIYCLAHMHCN